MFCANRPAVHVARRFFSAISPKAIIYSSYGQPSSVLRGVSLAPLGSPSSGTLNIRYLLAPINPADINTIEGSYPFKPILHDPGVTGLPEPVYIAGNEGVAQVTALGSGVDGIEEGDWVVMANPQSGTWRSERNIQARDVLRVPRGLGKGTLSEVQAATLTVNPPTAYRMLTDFVRLELGDYVIQNGANSAVGQAVIQIASQLGLRTINFVRSRSKESLAALKAHLTSLGATHVFTYDDLSDEAVNLHAKISEWTAGKKVKLGLNCVGGKETALMARLLGRDAHLVSYGAMSKQPLSLPTSLHIFKNLTSHGYWQQQWYSTHSRAEREEMMKVLVRLMEEGKLREPEHEILSLTGPDDQIGKAVCETITRLTKGKLGKKVLIRFQNE